MMELTPRQKKKADAMIENSLGKRVRVKLSGNRHIVGNVEKIEMIGWKELVKSKIPLFRVTLDHNGHKRDVILSKI